MRVIVRIKARQRWEWVKKRKKKLYNITSSFEKENQKTNKLQKTITEVYIWQWGSYIFINKRISIIRTIDMQERYLSLKHAFLCNLTLPCSGEDATKWWVGLNQAIIHD